MTDTDTALRALSETLYELHPMLYPSSWPNDYPEDIGPNPSEDAANIIRELATRGYRLAAASPPALDEERLAREMDRHWLFRTEDGIFHCTADDWTLDPDGTIAEGDRVYPFTQHVAAAIARAYAAEETP